MLRHVWSTPSGSGGRWCCCLGRVLRGSQAWRTSCCCNKTKRRLLRIDSSTSLLDVLLRWQSFYLSLLHFLLGLQCGLSVPGGSWPVLRCTSLSKLPKHRFRFVKSWNSWMRDWSHHCNWPNKGVWAIFLCRCFLLESCFLQAFSNLLLLRYTWLCWGLVKWQTNCSIDGATILVGFVFVSLLWYLLSLQNQFARLQWLGCRTNRRWCRWEIRMRIVCILVLLHLHSMCFEATWPWTSSFFHSMKKCRQYRFWSMYFP